MYFIQVSISDILSRLETVRVSAVCQSGCIILCIAPVEVYKGRFGYSGKTSGTPRRGLSLCIIV